MTRNNLLELNLKDNMTIMIGGIGGGGYPRQLIRLIKNSNVSNLTLIFIEFNAVKDPDICIADLALSGKVKKIICSHLGCIFNNKELLNSLEVEIFPMGVLSQKIQAGANKLPGIMVSKEIASIYRDDEYLNKNLFNGFVFEEALRADISIIHADKCDRHGNLYYDGPMYNSKEVAAAGDICYADVKSKTKFDFDLVGIPSAWVKNIYIPNFYGYTAKLEYFNGDEDVIQFDSKYTMFQYIDRDSEKIKSVHYMRNDEGVLYEYEINRKSSFENPKDALFDRISKRASQFVKNGDLVNLGFGKASLGVLKYIVDKEGVLVQSESCMIGMGKNGGNTPYHIDAGGQLVETVEGGSIILTSNDAFSLINSGKIDITFLGALEVAKNGDLANWAISEDSKPGFGGAVELAMGAKNIVVCMLEYDKYGNRKLVDECTKPLTARQCVDYVVTELGVYKVDKDEFICLEKWDDEKNEYVKVK